MILQGGDMVKFIVIIVAGYLLFKLVTGDMKKKQARQKEDTDKLVASGVMVKDPICGTYVDSENSIRVRKGDEVYNFCSYDCRDTFVKQLGDPEALKQLSQYQDEEDEEEGPETGQKEQ